MRGCAADDSDFGARPSSAGAECDCGDESDLSGINEHISGEFIADGNFLYVGHFAFGTDDYGTRDECYIDRLGYEPSWELYVIGDRG